MEGSTFNDMYKVESKVSFAKVVVKGKEQESKVCDIYSMNIKSDYKKGK